MVTRAHASCSLQLRSPIFKAQRLEQNAMSSKQTRVAARATLRSRFAGSCESSCVGVEASVLFHEDSQLYLLSQ